MDLKDYYDKLYSVNQKAFGGPRDTQDELARQVEKYLPKGSTVLDVGAGQGRQSLRLARMGYKVTALDLSQVGVDQINQVAKEEGLDNINAVWADTTKGIEGQYDCVICFYVLHHLSQKQGLSLIEEIKSHTKPNGLNIISTFAAEGDAYDEILEKGKDNFYPKLGELKSIYQDSEVLSYIEKTGQMRQRKSNGKRMKNVKAKIVARLK